MSLFILRHEHRFEPPTFFTSLTPTGKGNSVLLREKIKDLNIDIIYCSPFLRTIQTIYPYCKMYNKKINIEYSLYEAIHDDIFNTTNYKHSHEELYKDNPDFKSIINESYTSFKNPDQLFFPEKNNDIYDRTTKFMDHLIEKYKDKNILLVSHWSTLITIMDNSINKKFTNKQYHFYTGEIKHII